jgi:voltage-gated potassium channel
MIPVFIKPAATALPRNTDEGLNLSAIVNNAYINVPLIKPNCTAEVIEPKAEDDKFSSFVSSAITALPPNHVVVQRNCDSTITGKTYLELTGIVYFREDKVQISSPLNAGLFIIFKPMNWRSRLHEVIYESNTKAGKVFDVSLLVLIILSIAVVMLDSITIYNQRYGELFYVLEWVFTTIFTIEYILRLISIRKPLLYVVSFFGIIDLLAIIPTYLSFFFAGAQSLLVLRALRLLRIFRIFKLTQFLTEISFLKIALKGSLKKISIFMLAVLSIVIILGSVMYLVEGQQNGFHSIPESIYWAIVTITTVGYGDISPVTPLGKFIASIMMFIGYGIIAVPTGIVTTEMAVAAAKRKDGHETCPSCGKEGHDTDASYCKFCGSTL